MRITYQHKDFRDASMELIFLANEIIEEYMSDGFSLTLRQLYYQFVARGWLPNSQRSYKRLGKILNDARMAGLVDWDAIEDRTRNVKFSSTWDSPADIIESAAASYNEDLWYGQEYRPEVWIEKDALVGVIAGVCDRYNVPYFACRGYTSQSEQWAAGRRFREVRRNGQLPVVLHLGDHDPSGIDMTRDNVDRLETFSEGPVVVDRLALNMDQVRAFSPPPNPAKLTDSRAVGYIRKYGNESWELDALDPRKIENLIEGSILELIEDSVWDAAVAQRDKRREALRHAAENWEDVEAFLSNS